MKIGLGIIGLGEVGQLHTSNTGIPKPVQSSAARTLLRTGKRIAKRIIRGKDAVRIPEPGIPGSRLVAVSDVDERRVNEATERFEIPFATTDYKRLIARPDVDAVLICTPPATHAEITAEAARHGKHIFCEKPMARTSAQCMQMLEATERGNVILQIGYMLRFARERGRIVEAIRNGEIGRPVFYRETMNLRAGGPQPWIYDMNSGGGVIWEMSHLIDFYRQIFGEPNSVYAIGGRYKPNKTTALDTYGLALSFASGDKVLFSDSYALKNFGYEHVACRKHRQEVDVIGPGGYIQFPDADLTWKLTICRYADPVDQIDKMNWSNEWGAEPESYLRELEHFVECVRDKKTPRVPGVEGLRTVQLAETILRSVQTGELCSFTPEAPAPLSVSDRQAFAAFNR
jgi:predicted dehydrogenase